MHKRKTIEPIARIAATNSGETKCFVFVDELEKARKALNPFVNTVVSSYPFIKAFGVHCNIHKLSDLNSLECVKAVAPHTMVTTLDDVASQYPCYSSQSFIDTVNKSSNNLFCSKKISVAVIDTGLCSHLDFMLGKKIVFRDFINNQKLPYDDNGHGSAVAGILCGSGLSSSGKFCGIASNANLVALKAIGTKGEGGAFAILEAMQWIYDNHERYNIKIVCMSFGAETVVNGIDPLSIGAESLYKKGIVVVASAGNSGPNSHTIKSPGINPKIVTVGGASFENIKSIDETKDTKLATQQVTIPHFSSRGPAGKFNKPDIVAPSVNIASINSQTNSYQVFTGTSMAAPIVAGAAALLLSKKPNLTPSRVKEILLNSAKRLSYPKTWAGYGLLSFSFLDEIENDYE